jgi:hypothetical protein
MREAIAADFDHDPTFAEQREQSKKLLGWSINQLKEAQGRYADHAQSWRHIFAQALHWGAVIAPDGKKHVHGCPMEVDGFYRVCPTGPCRCSVSSTPNR